MKSVSPRCFTSVLENGELHRLRNFESMPLSLPKGPFVLAGGDYPYGCAMDANNEMTCWVAEGYQVIEAPPPGPFLTLEDPNESECEMCGIRTDGSLVCWKKPIHGDGGAFCDGQGGWVGAATGKYTKFMGSGFNEVAVMNTLGQLAWFSPVFGGKVSVGSLYASGGFVEASSYGHHDAGCAIRKSDSRVVCWGESEYGQFDPPKQ